MSDVNYYARPRKSMLWNFFTLIAGTTASCDLCRHKLSFKSTTNNLRKHIKRKHPDIQIDETKGPADAKKPLRLLKDESHFEVGNVQNSDGGSVEGETETADSPICLVGSPVLTSESSGIMTPSTAGTAVVSKNPPVKKAQLRFLRGLKCGYFNTKLMLLFVKDFQPYSIVEDKGFKEVVSFLSPTYNLPTKSFISKTAIPELYKKQVGIAKKLIKTGDIFCITLETWTSTRSNSFLSVTAHFVNEEFISSSLLLECINIGFVCNSENFAYEIKRIVSEWGIDEKIQFLVSESNSDIQSAVTDILGYEHFSCFATTLCTVVREAIIFEDVFKLIKKVSALVTHFKLNSLLYEKLISCQRDIGETNVGLKQLSDIRCFRSVYFMLEKFLKFKSIIKNLLEVISDDIMALSDEEWKMAGQLYQILKPFESVIMSIGSEKYCPASMVIPIVNGLCGVCDNLLKKPFAVSIRQAVLNIKGAIASLFGNVESSSTLSVCTFLDPRFKNLAFHSKDAADRAKHVVFSALTSAADDKLNNLTSSQSNEMKDDELIVWQVIDPVVIENRVSSEHTSNKMQEDELSVWSTFDNTVALSKPKITTGTQALAEVQRYLEVDIVPRKENPLDWWKENRHIFPQLSILAKNQLCAVSTSVPCDRIFSKAGLGLMDRRSKLSEKQTKMLVFLNANT